MSQLEIMKKSYSKLLEYPEWREEQWGYFVDYNDGKELILDSDQLTDVFDLLSVTRVKLNVLKEWFLNRFDIKIRNSGDILMIIIKSEEALKK